jgi:hypothetical protein
MLQVHLADGRTLKFDLQDEAQAREWLRQSSDFSFQAEVTGLTLRKNGFQYSVPRPQGFGRIWYFAEFLENDPTRRFKGGERVSVQIDDVRLVTMSHNEQRAVRVSLSKTGHQCYNPATDTLRSKQRGRAKT